MRNVREIQIIDRADEILSDQSKWTKHCMARTKRRVMLLSGNSPGAVCWCASGAIDKAMKETKMTNRQAAISRSKLQTVVQKLIGNEDMIVAHFNDRPTTTFSDIKNLFKNMKEYLKENTIR